MKRTCTFLAATLAMLASGCGSSQGQGSGKVTLLLKDAPAPDVRAAVVTITEVVLTGDSGKVVLPVANPGPTNLLTLANDVMKLVDGATVPAGTYSKVGFIITGGYLDVGGTIYASEDYDGVPAEVTVGGELQMPSYEQSGLKVILPGDQLVIGEGGAQTWLLDFDVSQSFGHGTGTDKWVMHPVIKGTPIEQTGSVTVALGFDAEVYLPEELSLGSFTATLTPVAGGDAKVLPLVDQGDGTYGATFQYLTAGDYQITFQAPAALSAVSITPATPATVTLPGGGALRFDFLLTSFEIAIPAP
ncbi:MAG TPA: DUF4382 domain-containing protein [Anaeromyxobacter sp.]|nr:DUF4382 domain-containing protein [Anaeromyxobacter sp.]